MIPQDQARSLGALAGLDARDVSPLSAESRNSLWRVQLAGDPGSAVLKMYDPTADRHAANRFRREEKVLTLLAGGDPPVAPRPLAGFVAPSGPSMLLMEDAGPSSLADSLAAGASDPVTLWGQAVEFVTRLHAGMERLRQPLYRTAMAISLDRISGPVLTARLRIAAERIGGQEPPTSARSEYRALMGPLLRAPRAMIHNSFSPLNIVVGEGGWRAVDWETVTFASPLWDWAELLRCPYAPLTFDECERIATSATGMEATLFQRAALSRCLDELGTVTLRRRGLEAGGATERAAEYARRAGCYIRDIREAARRLAVPEPLGNWIRVLTGEGS